MLPGPIVLAAPGPYFRSYLNNSICPPGFQIPALFWHLHSSHSPLASPCKTASQVSVSHCYSITRILDPRTTAIPDPRFMAVWCVPTSHTSSLPWASQCPRMRSQGHFQEWMPTSRAQHQQRSPQPWHFLWGKKEIKWIPNHPKCYCKLSA